MKATPKPKIRKPITPNALEKALKEAFGNNRKRMEQFVAGCRKAYSTGQPEDTQAESDPTAS